MDENLWMYVLGAAVITPLVPALKRRLELSRAKHRSLSGHSRMAKRIAKMIPFYAYGEDRFFNSDGAPPEVAERRRAGLKRLGDTLRERAPKSIAMTAEAQVGVSDMQFTSSYRVPYQYSGLLRQYVKTGSFTPATLSIPAPTRTRAVMLPSETFCLKFPAAYSACVNEKKAEDESAAIPDFVSAIDLA